MLNLTLDTALSALELMTEPSAILDATGAILATNEPWDEFARANDGDPATTGTGVNYLEICDTSSGPKSDGSHEVAAGIRRVLSGAVGRFQLDYPCPTADGQERWYRVHARRLANQAAAVVSHHELLPGDVEMSAPATHMAPSDNADDRVLPFIAGATHELRTPLTAILGFAASLRTYWSQLDDDRRLTYLDRIERNAHRLEEVLEEFLLIARIEADAASPQAVPVDVSTTIQGSLQDAIDIHVEYSPTVAMATVDPGHLQLMLRNLISNAIKYGRGPLCITVDESADAVVIRVRDHGDGIPADLRGQLFERFSRAGEHESGSIPGSGLGLSIVRDLAELNLGQISYEDADPGACFILQLPR